MTDDGILPRLTPDFGRFTMGQVLAWNNRPVVYTAVDDLGTVHLAMTVTQDAALFIPVSLARLNAVRAGRVSVKEAYTLPERDAALLVYSDGRLERLNGVPAEYLPQRHLRFNEKVESEDEFTPDWLHKTAYAEQRHLIAIELRPADGRKEPTLREMSDVLVEYQEVTDRLHEEVVGPSARKRDEQDAEQTFVRQMAASVVFVVAAAPGKGLFNSGNNGAYRLVNLIETANHQENFQTSLRQLNRRTIVHLRNFFAALSESRSGLSMFIADPTGAPIHTATAPLVTVESGLEVIRYKTPLQPKPLDVVGRLVAIDHDKGTFGIHRLNQPRGDRRVRFNGKIDGAIRDRTEGLRSGKKDTSPIYQCTILQEEDESLYTAKQTRKRYTLTSIELYG